MGWGDLLRQELNPAAYLLLLKVLRHRSWGPIPRSLGAHRTRLATFRGTGGCELAPSRRSSEGAAGAAGAGHRAFARKSSQRTAPQALSCGGGARLLKAARCPHLEASPLPSVPACAGDARGPNPEELSWWQRQWGGKEGGRMTRDGPTQILSPCI